MNQLIETPPKNEWGLANPPKKSAAIVHWKESAEYQRTHEFVRKTYGPFGGVVFAAIGVIMLTAIGVWGLSLVVDALELVINALRNMPNAGSIGGAVGSIAGALFAAGWKAALAALVLFPVWYGLKRGYARFLTLLSPPVPIEQPSVIDLDKK